MQPPQQAPKGGTTMPAPPPYIPRPRRKTSNVASCVVATLFLIVVAIVLIIVFFTLFRARQPSITVRAIMVPDIAVDNTRENITRLTVRIVFGVKNPNRASFNYYDSTVQVLYYGHEVASLALPAGKVPSGRTQEVFATMVAQPFHFQPLTSPDPYSSWVPSARVLLLQMTMRLGGRVNVLHMFAHHVDISAKCSALVGLSNGAVVTYRCSQD